MHVESRANLSHIFLALTPQTRVADCCFSDKRRSGDSLGLERFFSAYKMLQAEPTDRKTLPCAWEIGKAARLRYVYCGNLRGLFRDHTACYRRGKTRIRRTGLYELQSARTSALSFLSGY
jgi:hypothetical protein